MLVVAKDRVLQTSTTPGAGTYTFSGVVAGFQAFGLADGDTCRYFAADVDANGVPIGDWEVGIGTAGGSGTTLARTVVEYSSNANAAVSWGVGTRRLSLSLTATGYNPGVALGFALGLAYQASIVTLGDMTFQRANTSVAWTAPTHADPTLLPGYWTTYGAQKSVALGDFGSGAVQPTLMAGNGAGTVCAVGTGGILTTTDNGANWLTLQGNFYSVVFANSKFVAVGDNGLVAYSSDGYAWTFIHAVNKTTSWRFVIWDAVNSLFLAAGIAGAATTSSIMTSPDGVTWTSRVTSASGSGYNKIALGGIYQVAVGTGKSILTAQNGTAWTTRTVTGGGATQNFVDVAYSGSGWAAVGTFATGNYAYIGVANPTGTWTAGNLGTLSLAINCITVFNSLFVVGVASATAASNIQTAPAIDPSTWTARNSNSASPVIALGSDGTTLVGMGAGVNSGFSSTDGTTYTARAITVGSCSGTIGSGPIGSLTYLNGIMVETCTYSASGSNVATVSMGATPAYSGVYNDLSINGASSADVFVYGAAYGAGVYVVVGARLSITTSTNMSTFAMQSQVPSLAPQSVECDGANFAIGLAGAASGSIYYSANGLQWKRKNVVSSGGATIARYGGGKWVCANSTGTTANSVSTATTPGGTWTAQTTGIAAPYDIKYSGVKWILTNNSTTVQRSSDAITWNSATLAGTPVAYATSPTMVDNGIVCIADGSTGFNISNDDGATWARFAALGSNDAGTVSFVYTGTGYLYSGRYGCKYAAAAAVMTTWTDTSAAMLAALGTLVATASNQMPQYFRIGTRVFAILYSGASAFTPDFAYSDDNLTTWYGGNWSSAAPTVGVVLNNRHFGVLVSNGYLYVIIGTIQISVGPASPIVPTSVYIYAGSSGAPQVGTAARLSWYGRVK